MIRPDADKPSPDSCRQANPGISIISAELSKRFRRNPPAKPSRRRARQNVGNNRAVDRSAQPGVSRPDRHRACIHATNVALYKCSAASSSRRNRILTMLSKLPPRERQIVDILYERIPSLVADICDALPDELSGSAVRAMLKRLEDKGYVQRIELERGFLYNPAVSDTVAKKSALSEIVRVFFNGSPASAASALSVCPRSSRRTSSTSSSNDSPRTASKRGQVMSVLIAIALKSLVIAGLTLGLLGLTKKRSAAERSWVAHIGLLALVIMAFAPLVLPSWNVETPALFVQAPAIEAPAPAPALASKAAAPPARHAWCEGREVCSIGADDQRGGRGFGRLCSSSGDPVTDHGARAGTAFRPSSARRGPSRRPLAERPRPCAAPHGFQAWYRFAHQQRARLADQLGTDASCHPAQHASRQSVRRGRGDHRS